MDGKEQRAHERVAVRHFAHVRTAGGCEFEGVVENLGGLGALVSTSDLETVLAVGDRVTLRIVRDGAADVAAEGEVLRLDQAFLGGDLHRMFAVKFDEAVAG